MDSKLRLCLGFHNHQPDGNFDHVIADALKVCYKPMLDVAKKFPKVRWNVHFSGPLLLWLMRNDKELLHTLRDMAEAGQIEILGSGFSEPILCSISPDSVARQIEEMNKLIHSLLGVKPRGIWLTERVWEPNLPEILAPLGVEFVLVDDYHFFYAGMERGLLDGYYTAEKHGHTLKVFPISEDLRYRIPFKPADELIIELRQWAREYAGKVFTYVDDGEKFGVWPGTYEWVYEKRWLELFLEGLTESSDVVETALLSEIIDSEPPKGRIALPTASYREMMEWALPPRAVKEQEKLLAELGDYGFAKVKGGFWDQFLVKYEESNRMHKYMLYAESLENRAGRFSKELLLAQCNDVYWHGLFGGLYLPFLRGAVFSNVIKSELGVDAEFSGIEVIDFTKDGAKSDVVVRTPEQTLVFSGSFGGAVYLWADKRNLRCYTDTLTRREEPYHAKVHEAYSKNGDADNPKSIHEIVAAKEEGLDKLLVYDKFLRAPFVSLFVRGELSVEAFEQVELDIVSNFHNRFASALPVQEQESEFEAGFVCKGVISGSPFELKRTYKVPKDGLGFSANLLLAGTSELPDDIRGVITFDFMPDRWNEDRWIEANGERIGFAQRLNQKQCGKFLLHGAEGRTIEIVANKEFELIIHPIETVSVSEAGFEKNFQGAAIYLIFPVSAFMDDGITIAAQGV